MDKFNLGVILLSGFITVIILMDVTDSRGILRGKHGRNHVKTGDTEGIVLKKQGDRLNPEHIRCKTQDCDDGDLEPRRHRHGHGKRKKGRGQKGKRKNRGRKRKNRRRKNKHGRPVEPENIMQTDEVSSRDHLDLAAYDQYYAGYGREFDRLQRPPEADRLERRLRPNLASSSHRLLESINRVMMSLKAGIQEMHDFYDFAFNSTRYNMMSGVREELKSITNTNNIVYDTVMDVSLMTKDIYMRAHKKGLTRPTTLREPSMPEMKSLSAGMNAVLQEQILTQRQRDQTRHMIDECEQQAGHLQQLRESFELNENRKELADLIRLLRYTVQKLQMEFDTAMAIKRLERVAFTSGSSTRADIREATRLVRQAKEFLRTSSTSSRGNNIAYEEWKRRQDGNSNILAPVSYTDLRRRSRAVHVRRSRDISAAEKARLRPIIDRAVRHAQSLVTMVDHIVKQFHPLIQRMKNVIESRSGGSGALFVQAGRLEDYIQGIHLKLDKIRLIINDEEELRRRCEELETGSGDDGESTPIDCDNYLEEGSTPDVTSSTDVVDSEFIFEGDRMPEEGTSDSFKRFGDKLKVHVVQLKHKSEVVFSSAQTAANKTRDMSLRWNRAKAGVDLMRRFVSGANDFNAEWPNLKDDMDRSSQRVKDIVERVNGVADLTNSKTVQAVRKAERKVEEVKGTKGLGGSETASGDNSGDTNQAYVSAVEASGKAKRNVNSIVTLTRVTPTLVSGMDERISKIKSNISNLRSKVNKARLLLSSMQMSIKKEDEGYLPLPLTSSDTSESLHTSIELCVKPQVDEGPLLLVMGNNSESYGLSVSGNTLTMTAYDNGGYELGDVSSNVNLDKDKWYSLNLHRFGTKMTLSVQAEDAESPDVAEETMKMSHIQPPPLAAYIGGAPDDVPMSIDSGSWKGCLGGLRVNGRSVGLMQKTSALTDPVPCHSHCSPSPSEPSLVFEGNGIVYFPATTTQLRYSIRSVYFEFRTRQENAFIMRIVRRGFHLLVQMKGGTLLIKTTTPTETVLLQGENRKYNDGNFHKLKIGYRDSTTYPEIDGKEEFSVEQAGRDRQRHSAEGIFVGSDINEKAQNSRRLSPLIGCVRQLQINDDILTMSEVENSENVYMGSCSQNNMWFSCVQFNNQSTPISLEATTEAKTVVLAIRRDSFGTVLHYKKGEKFDIVLIMKSDGIEITETVKKYDGKLSFEPGDLGMFLLVKVTDDDSNLVVEYGDQKASINYGGGIFGGWLGGGNKKTDYAVTLGGNEEDATLPKFLGGIAQAVVGETYLNLSTYIQDNKLGSCERPESVSTTAEATTVASRKR